MNAHHFQRTYTLITEGYCVVVPPQLNTRTQNETGAGA
jgi:hypothetical protein